MITSGLRAHWHARNSWAMVTNLLLVAALTAVIYLALRIVWDVAAGELDPLETSETRWRLLPTAMIYLTGHGLRILRLALLIGGWRVGFRVIGGFHLMTAAVSLAVPLKLGEAYRVFELSNLTGSFTRAVAIAWWERAFDVFFILIILLLAIMHLSGAIPSEFTAVIFLAIGFIILTVLAFFVLPDNLRRLSVLIIRRYGDPGTVPVLRRIDAVRRGILEAPRLVQGKVATVATLSALIWLCEVACFIDLFPNVSLGKALDSLLSFLSAVTRGATLLDVLDTGSVETFGTNILAYLAATQIPLAFLGLIASVSYASYRFRLTKSASRTPDL